MSFEPFSSFLGTRNSLQIQKPGVYLLGYPFDGTTSFRPGARFGPEAIRQASFGLETYSPYLDADLEDYEVFDLGNLELYPSRADIMRSHFDESVSQVINPDTQKLLTLGGEHSISYMPIKRMLEHYEDLKIIQLDAHADLRDGYLDEVHSHASIMRRIQDHFGAQHTLCQYGIRSGTKEEYEWMKENKTLKVSLDELIEEVKAHQGPLYLTLDLDFFDPAFLPGTGTPEAGGETFHSFIKLLKVLREKKLVGADITELAPMLDSTGNSSAFASKVCRELLILLAITQ